MAASISSWDAARLVIRSLSLEVKRAMAAKAVDVAGLVTAIKADRDLVQAWIDDPFYKKPGPAHAIELSRVLGVPLHPRHVYFWNALTIQQLEALRSWLATGKVVKEDDAGNTHLTIQHDPAMKQLLERLCIPHVLDGDSYDFLDESLPLIETLGLRNPVTSVDNDAATAVDAINKISEIKVRDKAPYFMGLRMGRPEKAKERKMNPPVHVLFPIGHDASAQRIFQDAMKKRIIKVDVANRACPDCGAVTFLPVCHKCKVPTVLFMVCGKCKKTLKGGEEVCPSCGGNGQWYSNREINLVNLYAAAMKKVNFNMPTIKAIKGLSSKFKIPEPLEKGMLRAKHEVYVYKDGTARFDTGDVPLTHFCPREIFATLDDMKRLGYTHDVFGKPLESVTQICGLKIQDILLPKASLKYLFRVATFVDDLLEKVYGMPRYYNIKTERDFIGQLIIGLAPHTSAGIVGRVIGFTTANVWYAHPVYHAAKRRNCDGDEDGILLFLDVILNFSRYYLPSSTGAKMDTPLVISSRVVPEEVDAEAHNVDTSFGYPIAFYERSQDYPDPKDLAKLVETIKNRLGKVEQYEGAGFTHPTTSINEGPKNTAYTELGSMEDKITAQFALAKKIAAVDGADQAKRVISAHFTPDIMGNLRAFTSQQFRCTKCNEKYRRPPLSGKCKCGNPTLALTVSAGSIKKYLELALNMVKEYHLPAYTLQKMTILAERVESTVFNGTKKQMSLSEFI